MKITSHCLSPRSILGTALLSVSIFIAPGCKTAGEPASSGATMRDRATLDRAAQSALTPDQALARLTEGNHRFVTGAGLHRDYPEQMKAAASGQFPAAVVLCCLDSRSAPELIFDQGIGDIFVGRVAGNYCPVDL